MPRSLSAPHWAHVWIACIFYPPDTLALTRLTHGWPILSKTSRAIGRSYLPSHPASMLPKLPFTMIRSAVPQTEIILHLRILLHLHQTQTSQLIYLPLSLLKGGGQLSEPLRDNQSPPVKDASLSLVSPLSCLSDISTWKKERHLQLNLSKTLGHLSHGIPSIPAVPVWVNISITISTSKLPLNLSPQPRLKETWVCHDWWSVIFLWPRLSSGRATSGLYQKKTCLTRISVPPNSRDSLWLSLASTTTIPLQSVSPTMHSETLTDTPELGSMSGFQPKRARHFAAHGSPNQIQVTNACLQSDLCVCTHLLELNHTGIWSFSATALLQGTDYRDCSRLCFFLLCSALSNLEAYYYKT